MRHIIYSLKENVGFIYECNYHEKSIFKDDQV
jgi:hypothetical protein